MTEEINQDATAADKVKALVAALLVVGGIIGYYMLSTQPSWQRWLIVAAGMALAVVVMALSAYGRGFKQFVTEARVELRKVVWPDLRTETLQVTVAVFIFVIVAGLFFWLLDLGLAWATKALSGQGGV
jgi:preprotein translocase subunit SecE